MRVLGYILMVVLMFAVLSSPYANDTSAKDQPNAEAAGTVTHVVDGDTFDVTVSEKTDTRVAIGETIRIRLADIDTPEIHGAKACQAGRDAANYTRSRLDGKHVSLDLDDSAGKDVFNRWIAVCYIDGKNFNEELVVNGVAMVKDFDNNEFNPDDWRSIK